jgi:4-aminobutyrate aminotransferase
MTGVAGLTSKMCLEHKMMILPTGVRETMRFVPALVVSEAEIDEALGIFEGALLDAVAQITHDPSH